MKVYISGPITGVPREVYRANFANAADTLLEMGFTPVNPTLQLPDYEECGCPQDPTNKHEWSCYMRQDIVMMLDSDIILMLPGWEKSHGARLELAVAAACGLRVAMSLRDLYAEVRPVTVGKRPETPVRQRGPAECDNPFCHIMFPHAEH